MASTAAAAARHLREAAGAVFLIEDVECRKTHVSHFLFAKNEALIGCSVQRLRNVGGRKSGCRCASRQRKTQSSGAQCRHTSGFGQALPLRNLLHPGHVASSMQVFRFQPEKLYVWLMRHASWSEFTNSLLYIHFPFMLINSAPLRHDHDRIRSGRAHYDALPHGARSEQFER